MGSMFGSYRNRIPSCSEESDPDGYALALKVRETSSPNERLTTTPFPLTGSTSYRNRPSAQVKARCTDDS